MTSKLSIAALSITLFCAVSSVSYAADEPGVTLNRPGTGDREYKVGDPVPDEYQRESMEVKDWKSRHLKAPAEHEQWVQINGKYALISVPTGTIKEMVNK
ncbi:RcnB family protein [Pseudomonas sp. NPDC090203]|jgi:Ni/Co efflux regulator RcnB|uniref:RcnB family protein n=1 Tax=Pseudomonas TaxID=286 RepID=UPI002363D493|nr:RcnB family protein [Pseudomonas putida]MDD1964767.1 RcnB family protein [Pseudomonas putida]